MQPTVNPKRTFPVQPTAYLKYMAFPLQPSNLNRALPVQVKANPKQAFPVQSTANLK